MWMDLIYRRSLLTRSPIYDKWEVCESAMSSYMFVRLSRTWARPNVLYLHRWSHSFLSRHGAEIFKYGLGGGGLEPPKGNISPPNAVQSHVTIWATIITSQGKLWMIMLIDFVKYMHKNFAGNLYEIEDILAEVYFIVSARHSINLGQ